MRTRTVVALVVLAALAASCASPRQGLAGSVELYTVTLDTLTQYRRAGLIDDEQAAEIESARAAARAALDAWRAALQAQESPKGAIAEFNAAMARIIALRTGAERRAGDE